MELSFMNFYEVQGKKATYGGLDGGRYMFRAVDTKEAVWILPESLKDQVRLVQTVESTGNLTDPPTDSLDVAVAELTKEETVNNPKPSRVVDK